MTTSSDDLFGILNRAADLRRSGTPFALATVTVSQRPTSARVGAKAVVTADGAIFGWVGGACSQPSVARHAREALESGEARVIRLSPDSSGHLRDGVVELAMTCHSGGTLEIFIEPFLPAPYLIVVGDSPIAGSLLTLGGNLGFETVAMASSGDVDASEVYPDLAFDRISPNRVPFVVVATMGTDDEHALIDALSVNPAYLALVGSQRRFESIADYLKSRGVTDEQLTSIHSPAGLDIRAETPAEIALSILAEIIPIRREMKPRLPEPVVARQSTIVIDPICGMEVDLTTAKFTLVVGDETLGFCCPACLRTYQREHLTA
jgi:xanthine dehydrogenase accessory factor